MRTLDYPTWVPPPGNWCRRGACRSYPTEWWYPVRGEREGGRSQKQLEEDAAIATRICLECCPVRFKCLSYAMTYREMGIWGGTDDRERKRLRKWAG